MGFRSSLSSIGSCSDPSGLGIDEEPCFKSLTAMAFFEWLEYTELAIWVGESMHGYPLMLSLHAIGLAMVVGVFSVLGLRLLGLFGTFPLSAFFTPIRIGWFGFLVNGLSGAALFSSQATTFVTSTPFLIKAAGVSCGGIAGAIIHWRFKRSASLAEDGEPQLDVQFRLLGLVSLVSWTVAIFAGRLIAYL